MDKSAVGFQDAPDQIGTNYSKVKPEVMGAKPSVLRAKFEDLNVKSQDNTKKPAERKVLEKGGVVKSWEAKMGTTDPQNMEKKEIVTGRNTTISNAISDINKSVNTDAAENYVKSKGVGKITIPDYTVHQQPIEKTKVEMPMAASEIVPEPQIECQPQLKSLPQLESPQLESPQQIEPEVLSSPIQEQPVLDNQVSLEEQQEILMEQLKNNEMPNEEIEEQYVLSPDNPGIVAVALYDYQATADDEISFDPNDIISHIEMVNL